VCKYETNPSLKQNIEEKCGEYLTRCEQIREHLENADKPKARVIATTNGEEEKKDNPNSGLRG
jgi:vacuolar protein-sorting-associated protein 4